MIVESLDDLECLNDPNYDPVMLDNLLAEQRFIQLLQVSLSRGLAFFTEHVRAHLCFSYLYDIILLEKKIPDVMHVSP